MYTSIVSNRGRTLIGWNLDVPGSFAILKATAQMVCPTVVSMVFDPGENTVYWCENREWENIREHRMAPLTGLG